MQAGQLCLCTSNSKYAYMPYETYDISWWTYTEQRSRHADISRQRLSLHEVTRIVVIAESSMSWPLASWWKSQRDNIHCIDPEPYSMGFWYKSCCRIVSSHSIRHGFGDCAEGFERAAIAWHTICIVVSSQKFSQQCPVWHCFQIHISDTHVRVVRLYITWHP